MSDRTLEQSKAIVEAGVKFGAWSWDDPNTVNDVVIDAAAATLIDGATQASAKGSVNDAVLEILHVAGIAPQSDVSAQAYNQRFGGAQTPAPAAQSAPSAPQGAFGQAPLSPEDVSAMARASVPEPQSSAPSEPAHSPAPAAGEIDINSIFPGYDDKKVKQIKDAVLSSAADGDLSPEEWEKIKTYEAAHEERKTILSLQPEFKATEPEPTPAGAFGTAPAGYDPSQQQVLGVADIKQESALSGDSIGAFYNGESISRAQQEGLPVPPQTTGEGVVMPIDITSTSDQELSRLATAYHSLFARTQWLVSQEEGRERAAEQLEHDAHRDAYTSAYENHKSAIAEDKRGPTALDAARKLAEKDADSAHPVHTWRTRKIRHSIDARELKALGNGYDKAVWRINEELDRRARLATTGQAAPR